MKKTAIIVLLTMSAVLMRGSAVVAAGGVEWPATMNPIAPIAIIGIDADTLYYIGKNARDNKMYGGDFPMPRIWYSKLIQVLRESNAQVIAIDYVLLNVPPVSESDKRLAEVVAAGPPPIIVGFDLIPTKYKDQQKIDLKQYALPNVSSSADAPAAPALALPFEAVLEAGATIGSVNFIKDDDGMVRRGSLLVKYGGYALPSMALQIFMKTERIGPQEISFSGGAMNVRGVRIPVEKGGSLRVALPPAKSVFPRYSFLEVVKPKEEFLPGAMEKHIEKMKEYFKGRIVIVGPMDVTLGDMKDTPAGRLYPGVEVIAATANHLLNLWARERGIRTPIWMQEAPEPAPQENMKSDKQNVDSALKEMNGMEKKKK